MNEFFSAHQTGFIVALIGPFIAILSMMFIAKDWQRLARLYPMLQPFTGQWQRSKTVSLDMLMFNKALYIGTTAEYLYLRSAISFIGKPLQIPWSAISNVQKIDDSLKLQVDNTSLFIPYESLNASALARLIG
ncbi:MAG: hypothetical protein K2W82_08300 [Candidatus Obscuribacterales bacterium]|nr:hypothetical protein [Candidatus Obscuribacterales bacterium]